MKKNFLESDPIKVIASFLHVKDLYNFSKTCNSLYKSLHLHPNFRKLTEAIHLLNQQNINFQTFPKLSTLDVMEKICFLNLVANQAFKLDCLSYYKPAALKIICSPNLTSLLLDKYITKEFIGLIKDDGLKTLASNEAVTAFHDNKISEKELNELPSDEWERKIMDSISQKPSK